MKNIILTIMVFTVMTLTTGCSDNGVNPYSECSVIKKDIPRWEILPVIECMGIRSRYSTEEMRLIDSMTQQIEYYINVCRLTIKSDSIKVEEARERDILTLQQNITDSNDLEKEIIGRNIYWNHQFFVMKSFSENTMNIQFRNWMPYLRNSLRPEDRSTFTHWQETNEIPCCK
jgi:hypothetical protein